MGRGGFDPVCGFVERIVESVASFVFFHALDPGSVGLSGILGELEGHCEYVSYLQFREFFLYIVNCTTAHVVA